MSDPDHMKSPLKIHLMGIGGTGMASLAGMLKAQGHQVQGSDQGVYPPMSEVLKDFGILVFTPYDPKNLSDDIDLVVIGNVISRGNPEVEAALERGMAYESMAEVIRKFFLQGKTSLVVAGTHGKTTTTSLLAWVLESAGKDPGFFVGGKPKNFPHNFKLGASNESEQKEKFFVLEGDEYDTAFFDKEPKFLHYEPKHLLLTSVEFDHADIYADLEAVRVSFRKLLKIVPESGTLIANLDFPEVQVLLKDFSGSVISYTTQENLKNQADYYAQPVSCENQMNFQIFSKKENLNEPISMTWEMPGLHNMSNALGVIALTRNLGLSWEEIQKGLQSFQGVARRQDILGEVRGITLIDDFAHHPTAVQATLEAIKNRYPQRRLWGVFEPRSNTSKRDVFQQQYAESFDNSDQVIIADVFQAHKAPEGHALNTAQLATEISARGQAQARAIHGVEKIVELLTQETESGDVILLMSNGDFGGLGSKLLKALEEKKV